MEAVNVAEEVGKVAEPIIAESQPSMQEVFTEEEISIPQVAPGTIVRGVLVKVADDEVLVDIGTKTEAVLHNRELHGLAREILNRYQVGDEIPVYVVRPESDTGHAVVSILRAQTEVDWDEMERLLQSQETFEVEVTDYNRGGAVARVNTLRGFIPLSHIDPERYRGNRRSAMAQALAEMVGQKVKVKVIEVDRRRGRLILSEKLAMEEWRREQKARLLRELEEGDICVGKVTGICDFGAFVDIGGAEGLIHISELSWTRVSHPGEVLKRGDEVEVYVLDVDRDRGRISLSLKRLQPEPWSTVEERYYVGQIIEGKVTKLTPFGAFVEVEPGIEGLLHISEISFKRINHPREVLQEGQTVRVQIVSLDPVHRRMGLSLKRVAEYEKSSPDWRRDYEEYVKAEETETGEAEAVVESDEASVTSAEEPATEVGPSDDAGVEPVEGE